MEGQQTMENEEWTSPQGTVAKFETEGQELQGLLKDKKQCNNGTMLYTLQLEDGTFKKV